MHKVHGSLEHSGSCGKSDPGYIALQQIDAGMDATVPVGLERQRHLAEKGYPHAVTRNHRRRSRPQNE